MTTSVSTHTFAPTEGVTHNIRTATLDGEPWFVAADVCRAIGLQLKADGVQRYLGRLDKGERRLVRRGDPDTGNLFAGTPQVQALTLISESGLYKLIMRSDKDNARPFQDWVTKEVLPSIRKTGSNALAANYPVVLGEHRQAPPRGECEPDHREPCQPHPRPPKSNAHRPALPRPGQQVIGRPVLRGPPPRIELLQRRRCYPGAGQHSEPCAGFFAGAAGGGGGRIGHRRGSPGRPDQTSRKPRRCLAILRSVGKSPVEEARRDRG